MLQMLRASSIWDGYPLRLMCPTQQESQLRLEQGIRWMIISHQISRQQGIKESETNLKRWN
jgi:hypothetical protein